MPRSGRRSIDSRTARWSSTAPPWTLSSGPRRCAAAKSLTAWLQKHPGDHPDEDLLNILGTALFIADQHTTGKSKLEQFAEIYQKENERLEQTRPGEKRWGVEWLPERVVDKKMAERDKASRTIPNTRIRRPPPLPNGRRCKDITTRSPPTECGGPAWRKCRRRSAHTTAIQTWRRIAKENPDMTWLTEVEPVLPPLPQGMTAVAVAAPAGASDAGEAAPPSVFSIPNVTLHDRPAPSSPNDPPAETPPARPVHISVPRYALAFPIDKTRLISSADVVGQVDKVRLEDAQGQPYTAHVVGRQDHLALLELDAGQGQFLSYLNLAENFSGGPLTCAVRAAGKRLRAAAGVGCRSGRRAAAPDAMGGEPGGSSASCGLSAVRRAGAGGGRGDRQTRRCKAAPAGSLSGEVTPFPLRAIGIACSAERAGRTR